VAHNYGGCTVLRLYHSEVQDSTAQEVSMEPDKEEEKDEYFEELYADWMREEANYFYSL
jgi:hypothetical protein